MLEKTIQVLQSKFDGLMDQAVEFFVLAGALDALTTLKFTSMGLREGNPLIVWFMQKFGTVAGIGISKMLPIFLILVVVELAPVQEKARKYSYVAGGFIWTLVVLNNIAVILLNL